jgi:hypothetical protein
MIEVYRVPISKAQFQTMPPKERAMVLVCCHMLNQIGVIIKLVRFSSNRDPENPIEESASGVQTQIVLRFLIGVLSEACVYFEERQDIITQYLPDIHDEGREAYAKLQAYFDRKGLLRMIRNKQLSVPLSQRQERREGVRGDTGRSAVGVVHLPRQHEFHLHVF